MDHEKRKKKLQHCLHDFFKARALLENYIFWCSGVKFVKAFVSLFSACAVSHLRCDLCLISTSLSFTFMEDRACNGRRVTPIKPGSKEEVGGLFERKREPNISIKMWCLIPAKVKNEAPRSNQTWLAIARYLHLNALSQLGDCWDDQFSVKDQRPTVPVCVQSGKSRGKLGKWTVHRAEDLHGHQSVVTTAECLLSSTEQHLA